MCENYVSVRTKESHTDILWFLVLVNDTNYGMFIDKAATSGPAEGPKLQFLIQQLEAGSKSN